MRSQRIVIGTSGHIDHGKTTLVKALTGVDTDRLAEEKQRNISIELGFAEYNYGGVQCSFIDVPGHERFIRNMAAGVAGIDAVLMVIAADDGIMPQTLEHLRICDLLGIPRGIIVISRADLVDEELIALNTAEIKDVVKGTFLENAPLVAVSAHTEQGLEQLHRHIAELVVANDAYPEKPFRLPIDRSFTMRGFGTIVTGTVISGTWHPTTNLHLYPQATAVTVRNAQIHGQPAKLLQKGDRAALNLRNITHSEIRRGSQLAEPQAFFSSRRIDVELQTSQPVKEHQHYHLHLSTQDVMVRLSHLENNLFRLHSLKEPIMAAFDDRFILRSSSPSITLGGGRVLCAQPRRGSKQLNLLRGLLSDSPQPRISALVESTAEQGFYAQDAYRCLGLSSAAFIELAQALAPLIKLVDSAQQHYLHSTVLSRIEQRLLAEIARYHQLYPERSGASRQALKSLRRLNTTTQRFIFDSLAEKIIIKGDLCALKLHQVSITEQQQTLLTQLLAIITEHGSAAPRRGTLTEMLSVAPAQIEECLNIGLHQKLLVKVSADLFIAHSKIDEIKHKVVDFCLQNGSISVAEAKGLLDAPRNHAVDLLEYLDSIKVTFRQGNQRQILNANSNVK